MFWTREIIKKKSCSAFPLEGPETPDITMSFPAARLETRIQEFVMYRSAVPVHQIGTECPSPQSSKEVWRERKGNKGAL